MPLVSASTVEVDRNITPIFEAAAAPGYIHQ